MVDPVKSNIFDNKYLKRLRFKHTRILIPLSIIIFCGYCQAQTAWPANDWKNAVNLSSYLPSSAEELSGMYWNNTMKRLLVVSDQGELFVLQMNVTTGQFSYLNKSTKVKNTEAVTQINDQANEFYIINEADYEIQKFTHNNNFSTVTKVNSWNLLLSKSTMTKTDNDGPEGIAFIPDSYLTKIGFVSAVTGNTYTSTRGMNGLLFLAHQSNGYVWVFDVNPLISDDYIFVGKYKTSRSESCELAFDQSTGLLYILHNIDDNYLEISDLTTIQQFGEYFLKTKKEYLLPNPSGSNNIEGMTLSPKYPVENYAGLWLCRDVTESDEKTSSLMWFQNFPAEGDDLKTGLMPSKKETIVVQQSSDSWIINSDESENDYHIRIFNIQGKIIFETVNATLPYTLNIDRIPAGLYLLQINSNNYPQPNFKKIIPRN